MNIAELFVSLGVKGADSAGKALKGVKGGLSDVKSMSLEAKAAIIGVVYGLERMMSSSAQMGTAMMNFNTLTGVSAKELQQWQYAMRQTGGSAEEVASSIKAVQTAMEQTKIGQSAPSGLARIGQLTGGITSNVVKEASENPMAMMKRLREYAMKETDVALRNQNLKSMGLSEGMIAGMARGGFDQKTLNRAPLVSDKEIGTLNQVGVAWSNLGAKVQRAFDHFTAKHGLGIVKDITMLTDKVLLLVEAFQRLAEQAQLFAAMGKAFEGWAKMMDLLSGKTDLAGGNVEKKSRSDKIKDFISQAGEAWSGLGMQQEEDMRSEMQKNKQDYERRIAPSVGVPTSLAPSQNQELNLTVNVTGEAKNAKEIGHEVKKAVGHAYRQMNAQQRGN